MKILHLKVGQIAEMKKKHPCGCNRFKIMRIGNEVRIICLGCGHDVTIERIKFESAVTKLIEVENNDTEGE